ncbi:MAG: alpha/beta hydrolase fold domain-containing protein [Roseiflexaceae bacterium]
MARASLMGMLFTYMLKRRNIKQMFADTAQTAQIIETCRQSNAQPHVLPVVKFKSRVERTTVGGMDTVVLTSATPSGRVVWYLHGGAYIFQASEFHWQMLDRLVQTTNATVIASIYPLAPNHHAADVIPALRAVYAAIVAETAPPNVYIAGDSAGGVLSLAVAQDLRDQQLPQPAQLWLLSPWLDIAMSNPEAVPLDAGDTILSIAGLVMAGQHWQAHLDARHPWVSPLFGDMRGVAPLAIWVGAHEIFLPDVRLLRAQAEQHGLLAHYVEAPGMFHAYAVFPVPEAKEVLTYMQRVLTQ